MTILTQDRNPVRRQFQIGSLTGAVTSQRVTEALKGSLRMVENHSKRVKAEESLTERLTRRTGTKVGLSDWVDPPGREIAARTIARAGITGLYHTTVNTNRK